MKTTPELDCRHWAYAHGAPKATARLRSVPEDFIVDEVLGFEPDGEGQHLLLQLRKRNTNTDWLARQLARFAGVGAREVSYAGLKDRNALTTQWFSLDMAGREAPDWSAFALEGVEVLQVAPHRRKLRRGALRGNRFTLTLRELTADPAWLERRLGQIAARGVPNYFGEQRFGHNCGNLARAQALFAGQFKERDRHKRGLYLSAARAFLFNQVLSRRVELGNWDGCVPGEALALDHSHAYFVAEVDDPAQAGRLAVGEVHPSGPLWGRGRAPCQAEALALEAGVVEPYALLREGLERAGMQQERRALRLPVTDLQWEWLEAQTLQLGFYLPAGSYATAVLRELVRAC